GEVRADRREPLDELPTSFDGHRPVGTGGPGARGGADRRRRQRSGGPGRGSRADLRALQARTGSEPRSGGRGRALDRGELRPAARRSRLGRRPSGRWCFVPRLPPRRARSLAPPVGLSFWETPKSNPGRLPIMADPYMPPAIESPLVVVSNRRPVTFQRNEAGGLEAERGGGGLGASRPGGVSRGRAARWPTGRRRGA